MSEDDVRRIVREEIAAALDSMTQRGTYGSDPASQVRAGRDYIERTYGSSAQTMTDPYRKDFKC